MMRAMFSLNSVCKKCHNTLFSTKTILKKSVWTSSKTCSFQDQFDPPYLEQLKPEVPEYDTLNIQIKGYDFAILESYQSLIHRIAKTMDITVEDCWATPATTAHIKKFKPNSSNIDCEYTLHTYERNTQVVDVPSTRMVMFAELLQAALPQGVEMSIHEHTPEHEETRYVPDYELNQLKEQLENIAVKKK